MQCIGQKYPHNHRWLCQSNVFQYFIYLFILFDFFLLLLILWFGDFVLTDTVFSNVHICGVRSMPAENETNKNTFLILHSFSIPVKDNLLKKSSMIFILFYLFGIFFRTIGTVYSKVRRYSAGIQNRKCYLEGNNFFSTQTHTPLTFRTLYQLERRKWRAKKHTHANTLSHTTYNQIVTKHTQNAHRAETLCRKICFLQLASCFIVKSKVFSVFLCHFTELHVSKLKILPRKYHQTER